MTTGVANSKLSMRAVDSCAMKWDKLRNWIEARPLQIIGYIVGLLIIVILSAVALTKAINADQTSTQIKNVACATAITPEDQTRKCRILLDKLLKNPTPEQVMRIKQLVKDTS